MMQLGQTHRQHGKIGHIGLLHISHEIAGGHGFEDSFRAGESQACSQSGAHKIGVN